MSAVKTFVDTNTLVYAFTADEPQKQDAALKALDACLPVISTQVIKEFSNVLFKKTNLGPQGIKEIIIQIIGVADIINEETGLILSAFDIHKEYQYSFYDSLTIASAIKARCQVLLSEDMQNGQVIGGKLTIVNPFH